MKMKIRIETAAYLLVFAIVFGFIQTAACAEDLISAEEIPSVPEGTWQREAAFPDWMGYVDDTLAMNSMVSFEGYSGQGWFYMTLAPGVESFSVFINGKQLDTSALRGGSSYRVDFSGAARNGKNTIQVTEIMPGSLKEAVKVFLPYPVVTDGEPESSGISAAALALIDDLITSDVSYGFPGAQLAVIRHGRLVYQNAWGRTNAYYPDGTPNTESAPITADTLFDLASVSKMFGVNYAMQKLLSEKAFSLQDKVSVYLGDGFYEEVLDLPYEGVEDPGIDTQRAWKADMTVRDLFCHQGGFPADIGFMIPDYNVQKLAIDPSAENPLFSGAAGDAETKAATIEAICKTPLLYQPGTRTKYSDLDYMLLGIIIEKLTGEDLDTYLKKSFLEPMGLSHITYNPLDNGFSASDCAATELNGNTRDGAVSFPGIRTQTLQGQVHDEKAWYCMGGVSGHAGLFGNAADLAKLAGVMLTGGYGETRFFSRNVIDLFTSPKSEDFGQWGLGWWRNGDAQRPWYFGTEADSSVFGHQGWTGTLVMVDPENDLVIVYLTNKINSPVTDISVNLNRFDGNWYTASTLGFVPQILSVGLDEDGDVFPQLCALVTDMAKESEKLIPEGASQDHPAVKNAQSKAAVAEKWTASCNVRQPAD